MEAIEYNVRHVLQQLDNTQLLDIREHGYHSHEYKVIEDALDGGSHLRTFILGRVAEELFARKLWIPGLQFDLWWESYTGY